MKFVDKIRMVLLRNEPGVNAQLLEDIGLSSDDYFRLRKSIPGARRRVLAMAQEFGLTADDVDAHRSVACDIAKTCGGCERANACQRWVDGHGAFDRRHCANASTFAELSLSNAG